MRNAGTFREYMNDQAHLPPDEVEKLRNWIDAMDKDMRDLEDELRKSKETYDKLCRDLNKQSVLIADAQKQLTNALAQQEAQRQMEQE